MSNVTIIKSKKLLNEQRARNKKSGESITTLKKLADKQLAEYHKTMSKIDELRKAKKGKGKKEDWSRVSDRPGPPRTPYGEFH